MKFVTPIDTIDARTTKPVINERVSAVRRAIFGVAIPMLIERGFDHVTVDDIADHVGVSRRTIFRYFPTKADIVLDWASSEGEGLYESLARQPFHHPLHLRLRAALADFIAEHRADHDWHVQIARLTAETPALRARAHEKFEHWEEMVCQRIAIDHGTTEPTTTQRVVVALFMAVYRQAIRQWVAIDAARPIQELLDEAFSIASAMLHPDEGASA